MTDIPRAVLSEHFQERMQDRRLVSAVFTTFRFDPGFFETDLLPVFFDIPLSHASAIKIVQLDEALRSLPGNMAVYYDQNGLVADGGSAKLDIRRVPMRHPTGIFHAKNVFALVEDAEGDDDGHRARALLCACLSANLTRAGWWENVEVGHVEEIEDGAHTVLAEPLIEYLDNIVTRSEGRRANDELRKQHLAINDIRNFLRNNTTQRERRSADGRLHTHFHNGQEPLPAFLENIAGVALHGLCLEVISPYFDDGEMSAPLNALRNQFDPPETRVYLPRDDGARVLCDERLFRSLPQLPRVSWGTLPADLLRLGKSEEAKLRTVHAKVYRFFEPKRGGREILYIGSTNLTNPGCRPNGQAGNWEAGFLVEVTGESKPDWWLDRDVRRAAAFAPEGEDEGTATSGGTQLQVRYDWNRAVGAVFWGGEAVSPALSIQHGGVEVFALVPQSPREWTDLGKDISSRLRTTLMATSLLQVSGESLEPGLLLVQEEGMSHRPSLLLELSPADILRYWSLLTVEQRNAFIEARSHISGDDDPLLARLAALPDDQASLFDRFAGVFHAFSCVEASVRESLGESKTRMPTTDCSARSMTH